MLAGVDDLTFGGSGFDRADLLRGDADALAQGMTQAETIVLWRGKPLMDMQTHEVLRISMDHAVLEMASEPIFMGLDQGQHIYAHDISRWEPSEFDAEQLGSFMDGSQNHHPAFPAHQCFVELRANMTLMSAQGAELASTAKAMFSWHRSHQFCAACGVKSEVSKSGWQRACSACSTPHFPRTDPVVIMLVTDGNNLLLGRAPNWPEDMYSCLAGFLEPGETIEAAVKREVLEETSIQVQNVRYVASQPWAFPSSLMIGCICEAVTTQINIDPIELQDAKWVSKETLIKSLSGKEVGLKPARAGAIASYLIQNWLRDRL